MVTSPGYPEIAHLRTQGLDQANPPATKPLV